MSTIGPTLAKKIALKNNRYSSWETEKKGQNEEKKKFVAIRRKPSQSSVENLSQLRRSVRRRLKTTVLQICDKMRRIYTKLRQTLENPWEIPSLFRP